MHGSCIYFSRIDSIVHAQSGIAAISAPTAAPTPAPTPPASTNTCYGHFTDVVVDEGIDVGQRLFTKSPDVCQAACTNDPNCKSFALCPAFHGCWMKDRALTGSEPTKVLGQCRTYYKMVCVVPSPTPPSTAAVKALSARIGRPAVTTTIRYYASPPMGVVGIGHHIFLSSGILVGAVVVSLAAIA